jgi:HSP20 family molecular chaperone IbpA
MGEKNRKKTGFGGIVEGFTDLVEKLGELGEKGEKKYQNEVLLPRSCPREKMLISCNNGVLEIKCMD